MTARRVTVAERRARLGVRHHLAPSSAAPDVATAAAGVVGLHGTDPASIYLSAAARVPGCKADDVSHALYDERTIVRWLGMRRTLFVEPVDVLAVVQEACSRGVARQQRQLLVRMVEEQGLATNGAAWVRRVEKKTLAALAELGEARAAHLSARVPELRKKLVYGEGKKWGGEFGVSSRVLILLGAEGHITRGRPAGSWLSTQYTWARTEDWLGAPLADVSTTDARAALVTRWLRAYGPATLADLMWWTGLSRRDLGPALAAVAAEEVDLDGTAGLSLAGDDEVAEPEPWVALLPSLDPTVMGWAQRDWYLSEHRPLLFDRNGNAGPTIWCDGRVVGGWAQRRDGEIALRLLDDVGKAATTAIEARAVEVAGFLGDVRFTPKFPTPLERELRS